MSHLQMLEHCLNWADSIDERRAMARRFAAFAPAPGNDLDLRDYALSPDTLAVWEDGLRMNGQTAEQARVAELRSRLVPAGR